MACITDLEVRFDFTRDGESQSFNDTFDCDDASLQYTVEGRRDEMLDELNDDLGDDEEEWDEAGFEVLEYDTDFADPADFGDLDEYGEYAELIVEFGEAYKLRYEDYGSCTKSEFEDHYNGEWYSFEDYAQNYVDDCMEIPENMQSYFDIEKFARDLSMDYSTYDSEDGSVHVFRA